MRLRFEAALQVRSLPQRPAGAAREIKALIDDSVHKAGQGNALVGEAGQTMREVVASVQHDHQPASSARGGASGRVNGAMAERDAITRQNATWVEQSASASANMAEEAAQSGQTLSVLRLGQEQGYLHPCQTPFAGASCPDGSDSAAFYAKGMIDRQFISLKIPSGV